MSIVMAAARRSIPEMPDLNRQAVAAIMPYTPITVLALPQPASAIVKADFAIQHKRQEAKPRSDPDLRERAGAQPEFRDCTMSVQDLS
jgi:hypothetical protein